jgi:hypothetical protein
MQSLFTDSLLYVVQTREFDLTPNTDHLWKIYESTSELIRFSDTKATALLAINGIIAGLYFSNVTVLREALSHRLISIVPLTSAIILILVSLYFSAWCIFPRLNRNAGCDLVFFGDIVTAHKTANEYEVALREAFKNNEGLFTQLSHEIYEISGIAEKKYKAVKRAILFLVLALLTSLVFMLTAILG